jgi:predicted GTPase
MAMQVYEDRKKKIKTSKLNEVMLPIFENTPPPATKENTLKSNIVYSFQRRRHSLYSSVIFRSM